MQFKVDSFRNLNYNKTYVRRVRGMFMTEEQFLKLIKKEQQYLDELYNQPCVDSDKVFQQSKRLDQLIHYFIQNKLHFS